MIVLVNRNKLKIDRQLEFVIIALKQQLLGVILGFFTYLKWPFLRNTYTGIPRFTLLLWGHKIKTTEAKTV